MTTAIWLSCWTMHFDARGTTSYARTTERPRPPGAVGLSHRRSHPRRGDAPGHGGRHPGASLAHRVQAAAPLHGEPRPRPHAGGDPRGRVGLRRRRRRRPGEAQRQPPAPQAHAGRKVTRRDPDGARRWLSVPRLRRRRHARGGETKDQSGLTTACRESTRLRGEALTGARTPAEVLHPTRGITKEVSVLTLGPAIGAHDAIVVPEADRRRCRRRPLREHALVDDPDR